jgi:LPXTG-site transpeptidase (sortase) family protein
MTLPTLIAALIIGLAFTLWLAGRPSKYKPMFSVRRTPRIPTLWWVGAISAVMGGALIIFAVRGINDALTSPDLERAEATVAAQGASRLLVPALKVDERIVAVPITKDGWDISRLGMHVGWLETTGVRPGQELALTLIGHVTVSAVQVGPFANLYTLRPLDEVIYRSGGSDYVYAINTISEVSPEDVSRLYVNKGDHLLLVTCTDWNYLTETYEGRLIVDAVLAKQVPSP